MSTSMDSHDIDIENNQLQKSEAILNELGYKQEFKREIGLVANIGLSLTAIGVLTGMSSAWQTGYYSGGPAALFWGWNVVSIFMFLIALSLAEICSVFPTAGGLYYWVAMLTPSNNNALAYYTGNLYAWAMVFTGTAGNLSVALYIASMVEVRGTTLTPAAIAGIAYGVNILSGILNTFGVKAIGNVSRFNVWFTLAGTLILVITLFVKAPIKNTGHDAFFEIINFSGWSSTGFVFILGFLQAVYALEGAETSAQIAEEAKNAEWAAPVAIASSVAGSWFVGVIYLLALNFCVQSAASIQSTSFAIPIVQLYFDAVGEQPTYLCVAIILFCQWAAALTGFTASSRLFFALARDKAFPMRDQFMYLNAQQTPVYGVWLSVFIGCVISSAYIGSAVAFNAIISSAAISVLLAYAMPIMCRVIWPSNMNRHGPFHLGKWSYPINVISAIFCIVMSIFFILPTSSPVTTLNMNYAIVAVGGVLVLITVMYFLQGRHYYKGPITTLDKIVPSERVTNEKDIIQ